MTKQELQTKLNYSSSCIKMMQVAICSVIDINNERIKQGRELITSEDVLSHLIEQLNEKEELTEEEEYDLEAACLLLTNDVIFPEKILNAKLVTGE